MRFKTSKHNIISLVAESEGDFMLLSILSKKQVRQASYKRCDGRVEELNLQFFEDALHVEEEEK